MTENEALKRMKMCIGISPSENIISSFKLISDALDELQQYRELGTVEELQSMKENGAFSGVELAQLAAMQMRLRKYEAIGTIEEFKALKDCGTHDCMVKHLTNECSYSETGCSDCRGKEKIRIALEKAEPKKPIYGEFDENELGEIIPYKATCPTCGFEFEFGTWNDEENHHCVCGQKLDYQLREKNMTDEVKENNKQLVCEIKIDTEILRKII